MGHLVVNLPLPLPLFPVDPLRFPPPIHLRLSSTGRWWRARPHTSRGASWPTTTQSELFLKSGQMQLVVRAVKRSPRHFSVALVSDQLRKRAGALTTAGSGLAVPVLQLTVGCAERWLCLCFTALQVHRWPHCFAQEGPVRRQVAGGGEVRRGRECGGDAHVHGTDEGGLRWWRQSGWRRKEALAVVADLGLSGLGTCHGPDIVHKHIVSKAVLQGHRINCHRLHQSCSDCWSIPSSPALSHNAAPALLLHPGTC